MSATLPRRAPDSVPHHLRFEPTINFALRRLSTLAYANGYTHWHYYADDAADARRDGFFRDAFQVAFPGDTVMVTSRTGAMMGWIDAEGTLQPMLPVEDR